MPDLTLDGLAKQETRGGFISLEEILFTRVAQRSAGGSESLDRLFADIGWRIVMAEQEYSRRAKSKNPDYAREYNTLMKYFTR